MTTWKKVPEELSYGIAIYNFTNDGVNYKLKLTVGDAVHLLEEEEDWYYGYIINKCQIRGIFPKNYIHIKQCISVDKNGLTKEFHFKDPAITQEITSVLREWGQHLKSLYVQNHRNFEHMKTHIYDLMFQRSKILSGTLPVDELKRVTRQAAELIDIGNNILGLDLVIRDKAGNLINPENTSTIELYYLHRNATDRMQNRSKKKFQHDDKSSKPKTAIQQFSNIFIVAVKNFTCKMSEDAELLMTLYDAKECKPITEHYVVRWTKEGLMSDLDQMYNLRVMFTDLGKRDLEREKIYLICNVVRIGAMDTKETDHRRSSVSSAMSKKNNLFENMRRPCGVAAMDITSYMNGTLDTDLEQDIPVPFVSCDKDNLEQTLRKIISKENKIENKNQALFVSMKLLHGDLKQVREENPHLVLGNVSIARKMGFPEVILPGDVRNDLYLTLVNGEFAKGNKKSDKNVEVVVKVCNEKGQPIPAVISMGGGIQPLNEYKSVIYYHEDKPQWYETFKVAIPIEEFKTSHLKFTFKHRSSNEAKDKSEKPFAMSYVKLMQENGTTLPDARHNLIVYKIDWKKFDENSLEYMNLPSTVSEKDKCQINGLSVSTKDSFTIASNICSTKLTQNVDLLGLLNWASHKDTLKESLQALMKVDGEEVVKFLQDILDALFNILMDNPETDAYDTAVFECLLHIISLVSNDWKYQHFEPVLDLYIKESFSATLAYKKLISVLKNVVSGATYQSGNTKDSLLFKTMKSLQYVMRFVSKSRLLFMALYADQDYDEENFKDSLRFLLKDIIVMMASTKDSLLREQGACLKYFPSTIPDILLVFDNQELSNILCDLLKKIPMGRLTKQKMMTINEIVHSKLFESRECRAILLPLITEQVKFLLETKEEVELCIKILSDILDLLFHTEIPLKYDDIIRIMDVDLRTVIQYHIKMERDNPHSAHLVAVMIEIFRQMSEHHYNHYIASFPTLFDVLDFLMEILVVFKELVNKSVFPNDWNDMIMLQNSIILKSLRYFSHTIRDKFFTKFEYDAWNNFFHCATAFMIQQSLQLEHFSLRKRMRIINRYSDMRREMGFEIRSMWFNLGQNKVQFVPALVGLILEMTLIPEVELRKATIPIFFDMMQCEFYSSRLEAESYGDTKRDSSHIKGNFTDFENEMIAKLDALFAGGRGDEEFKTLFNKLLSELCGNHTTMKEDGLKFVKIVTRLMESLLEYRAILMDENKENMMSCTVNLLDFYSEIKKDEMYLRYLNKLYQLHLDCDNFTEAAYTLELYTNLLAWSNEKLLPLLRNERYPADTHKQLKEQLYYVIIENFAKGKMWECALAKCDELVELYKDTFEYEKLGVLHSRMAGYYDDIIKKVRPEPEYFRVGYYGRGFPRFLQNKVLIHRGKEYERLADFNSRILNEFSKAELLNKLTPPGKDITESDKQYIQINKVDPIMQDNKQRFSGRPILDQIVQFYKVNNIEKFTFSRPFTKFDTKIDTDNEFAHRWLERVDLLTTYPLPGILRWFPVKSTETYEISPLRIAIETMEKTNRSLKNHITLYNKDKNFQINPLGLTLNGILDAAVMGGIKNYEEAFFDTDYEKHHPEDAYLVQKLKDLIADQIPLLDLCVQIHKQKASTSLQPLQKRFEDCFQMMKASVEEKYGKGVCECKLETEVQMRRHYSISNEDRISDVTITPDNVGGRSRVSSLTRSQVASLRNFTSSFNFTASSPSVNSRSQSAYSAKSLQSPAKSFTATPLSTSKKSHKTPKQKRRSSKGESTSNQSSSSAGATLWYTNDVDCTSNSAFSNGNTPIFELTQELTPKRPLRSEVERERRLSRPSSGQFSRPNSMSHISVRGTSSSGNSSNRDSVGTTDSSISEEDLVPPPIPAKINRDSDFSTNSSTSMNSLASENVSFLYSARNSTLSTKQMAECFVELFTNAKNVALDDTVPPTPPPKPPKNKHKHSNIS